MSEGQSGSFFGIDPDSWNIDTDAKIGISLFANALQVFVTLNGRQYTVSEAAYHFNCPAHMIADAVNYHPYMRLDGLGCRLEYKTIEHDGE